MAPKPRAKPTRTYPCGEDGCDFQTSTKIELAKHMRENHRLARTKTPAAEKSSCFPCTEPDCGKVFTRKFALQKHIETVHLDLRPFECPICQSTFGHKILLNRHTDKSHADITEETAHQPSKGPDKETQETTSMIIGLSGLAYEAERPFSCASCRQRFLREYDLERHANTCTGV